MITNSTLSGGDANNSSQGIWLGKGNKFLTSTTNYFLYIIALHFIHNPKAEMKRGNFRYGF